MVGFRLKLSKSRLSELLEFRKNGGFLEDINEVANFKGFTLKSVEQLYNQILRNNGEISDTEVYKVRGQILFPPAPDPIVSIDFSQNWHCTQSSI